MYPIFVHVHKFTLFKLNESSNSTCCTSKQHLELGNTNDSNIKFQAHINGRTQIERQFISILKLESSIQFNSKLNSLQQNSIFPNSATFYELGKVTTRM
jgi:hypothetical protein